MTAAPLELRRAMRRSGVPAGSVAIAGFLSALAVTLPAAGASYRYDESVTVASFVQHGWLTPFTSQAVHNNHPLFSFAEHLVWASGGRSEVALRLVPIGCFALTVALIAHWVARRWGPLPAGTAVLVLVTHPLTVDLARQARGYSLVTLTTTAATVLAIRLTQFPRDRQAAAGYVVVMAAGIATHLYAAAVVLCHVGLVLSRGRLSVRWLSHWVVAGVLGATAYVAIPPSEMRRGFQRSFPVDATWQLLGATLPSAVVLGACLLGALSRHRWDWLMVAAPVAAIAVVWGILDSRDIYPRFLVWAVPACSVATAWAVARVRWMTIPVAMAAVGMLAVAWPVDDPGIRDAAEVVDAARAAGATVCAVGAEALQAYTYADHEFSATVDCDVVVKIGSWTPAGYLEALGAMPYRAGFGEVDVATTGQFAALLGDRR